MCPLPSWLLVVGKHCGGEGTLSLIGGDMPCDAVVKIVMIFKIEPLFGFSEKGKPIDVCVCFFTVVVGNGPILCFRLCVTSV